MHSLFLVICVFSQRIEKEKHSLEENKGFVSIWKKPFLILAQRPIQAPLPRSGIIHR